MSTVFATPANDASSALTLAYGVGANQLTVANGSVFPNVSGGNFFVVTVIQVAQAYNPQATASNYTLYKATAVAGNVITIDSAHPLEGTTDQAYSVGDVVDVRWTAGQVTAICNAVNAGGGGGSPGGSSGQIQYNNSGAFGGSSFLSQNSTNLVSTSHAPGTINFVLSPATGTLVNPGTSITNNPALQLVRNSDNAPLVSLNYYWRNTDTDYSAGVVWSTGFIATPGPTGYAPYYQVWKDSTHSYAGQLSLTGNDLAFLTYQLTLGWQTAFTCSAPDNTSGSHIYAPIYTSGRNGVVVQGASGQTADLFQGKNNSGSVIYSVHADGSVGLPALANSSAANNSLFWDTTNSKLCYKDPSGNLHEV